jgi:hypothetical protein
LIIYLEEHDVYKKYDILKVNMGDKKKVSFSKKFIESSKNLEVSKYTFFQKIDIYTIFIVFVEFLIDLPNPLFTNSVEDININELLTLKKYLKTLNYQFLIIIFKFFKTFSEKNFSIKEISNLFLPILLKQGNKYYYTKVITQVLLVKKIHIQ